ncbi:DUF4421 family protein [Prevotella sp.]|uniref:DUF4421 family protein n=1 Tax=Prevotella sp. TaxID=59823 RepID=UPI0025E8E1ED|nr:DUF4421 family protein [Prevotella sp.]MCI7370434.1 DUF4421 domain-containing protein [Prevotella sp.]
MMKTKNMHITSSLWLLRVVLLATTLSLAMPDAAIAQEKKPRRKFKAWLMCADSLRLELRRSADRGQMLQWTDSVIMAEINKNKMSEKRKQRYMRRHIKIQKRLARYDRQLFRGDSLLAANYHKVKYDTAYIGRPDARWTIKYRGNLSGADMRTTSVTDGVQNRSRVTADCRGTLSMAVAYRGLGLGVAVNPAKFAGKCKDFEYNLNSYSNRYGFDVVFLSSKTYHGYKAADVERIDIHKGQISQNALNLNFYYAFNFRRFSFPAAFSQSYIQKRSAGSWMIGASFDGSKTELSDMTIRLNEFAVGAGYAYNLVAFSHRLFHLSALPTVTVYSHDYTKTKTTADDGNDQTATSTMRHDMKYHFPSAIITGRAAAVYSWRNKFAGTTAVYNYSVAGDEDHLQVRRNKWRVRMFFGFRF